MREGNQRPTRIFTSKEQAIAFARQTLRGKDGEIIVHTAAGDVSRIIKAA